jgi:hypothetical protein
MITCCIDEKYDFIVHFLFFTTDFGKKLSILTNGKAL